MRHTINEKIIIINNNNNNNNNNRKMSFKKIIIIVMNFLSLEALQLTTQGKNCMSGRHFRRAWVIHILVRNKLIFTVTNYGTLLKRH